MISYVQRSRLSIWGVVALLLVGCGLRPQLVKHYDSVSSAAAGAPEIRVVAQKSVLDAAAVLVEGNHYMASAFVLPVPAKASAMPAVLSFSDNGQAALVDRLGDRLSETSDLLDALARSNLKSTGACDPVGPLRFERRLVLSLAGRHSQPATRFDAFAYQIELIDPKPGTRFVSWTRFESTQDSVSLGTTRLKQSQSVSGTDVNSSTVTRAAVGTVPGSTLVDSLTAVLNASREMEESVTSTRRFAPLTGALSDQSAAIIQQGAVGIDLFGNLTADLTIEVGAGTTIRTLNTKGLFDKAGVAQTDPSKLTLNWCERMVPMNTLALRARVTAAGTLRQVVGGHETAIEGDDEAHYLLLKSNADAELDVLSESELSWAEYRIGLRVAQDPLPKYMVSSEPYGGTLSFTSLDQAQSVVRWLRATNANQLRGVPLAWPARVAYQAAQANDLEVHLILHKGGKEQSGPVWR